MERVTITGQKLRASEDEIAENIPEDMRKSMLERSVIKTDIGVFELDEFGDVTDQYSGSGIYNTDFDRFTNIGEFDITLIQSNLQLYYTTGLSNYLSEEDKILIDMSVVESEFDIDSDTEEIILDVDEVINLNVSGSQKECLSFLGETFHYSDNNGKLNLTGNDDYPDRSRCYVVRRSDENTMKQRTILNERTVSKLVKNGGIKELVEVN